MGAFLGLDLQWTNEPNRSEQSPLTS